MNKLLIIICIFLVGIMQQSCKEEGRIDHIDYAAPAPAPVSDIKVENMPGGAILKYQITNADNLAYVKAVCEIAPGNIREDKASLYMDTLKLSGFGEAKPYEVKVYSVGLNEKQSEPVIVTINPTKPPILISFEDLSIEATFGGVKIKYNNEAQANLGIVLLADTTGEGQWETLQTFYTKAPNGSFSYRGLKSEEVRFATYLRDRWHNKSDTLITTLIPLFEETIPKTGYSALYLPTDTYQPVESQYPIEKMWDNDIGSIFASKHDTQTPQWFTVDLGCTVLLSRMKEHQRHPNYTYTGSNVKSFEIWGTTSPDPDGSFNNWFKLGEFNSYKPSGLPMGQHTDEDINYAHTEGEDFEFDSDLFPDVKKKVRYIRFKTTATYGGGVQVTIAEIAFWGQIIK